MVMMAGGIVGPVAHGRDSGVSERHPLSEYERD
jgi:hypothetical protein